MIKKNQIILIVSLMFLFSLASAAVYEGELPIRTGEGYIIIGEEEVCQETWTSYWSECVDGQQTYICYDENACGTELIKPEDCGAVQQCTEEDDEENSGTESSSGSGSGSGSRSTSGGVTLTTTSGSSDDDSIEWVCGEWSECVNNAQTRICVDEDGKAESRTQTKYCTTTQELGNETSGEKGIIAEAGSKILGNFIEAGKLANSGTGIALLILYGILIGVFIIAIKKYY